MYFSYRDEWRNWLNQNHLQSNGIWVILQKKNSNTVGLTYLEALEEVLCFGWIDGKMRRLDKNQFIQWFSPRRDNSLWSLANKKRAIKLIANGKMTSTGFNRIEEAKRNGQWEQAYTSKGPVSMPQDLAEALHESSTANENFRNFSDSSRFIYIHWVCDAKRLDTRKKRVRKVVERAEKNLKPGIDLKFNHINLSLFKEDVKVKKNSKTKINL